MRRKQHAFHRHVSRAKCTPGLEKVVQRVLGAEVEDTLTQKSGELSVGVNQAAPHKVPGAVEGPWGDIPRGHMEWWQGTGLCHMVSLRHSISQGKAFFFLGGGVGRGGGGK